LNFNKSSTVKADDSPHRVWKKERVVAHLDLPDYDKPSATSNADDSSHAGCGTFALEHLTVFELDGSPTLHSGLQITTMWFSRARLQLLMVNDWIRQCWALNQCVRAFNPRFF
jgi:hypothetical protein